MHLHALIGSGEFDGPSDNYYLGSAFTVFNVISKNETTCFPVLKDTAIVAILDVEVTGGAFSSSLAVSFANELEKIIANDRVCQIMFITDGIHIHIDDGHSSREIFKLFETGVPSGNLLRSHNIFMDQTGIRLRNGHR